jgi:hypothetical protein
MAGVPYVRDRLRELAHELAAPELETLARELERRPPVRRAPVSSEPMTPELADAIRADAAANPDATMSEIAARYNVNPGRVSEVLAGKRA